MPQDFAVANHYIATHPASHFRKNLVLSRQTATGRVTLFNDCLRRAPQPAALLPALALVAREQCGRPLLMRTRCCAMRRVWLDGAAAPEEEQHVEGETALLAVLARHFGIEL